MKKYKYAAKIDFSFILGTVFFYGLTYVLYLIAKEDIDYIALKGGVIHVSPDTSTLFYGLHALFFATILCWGIFKVFKNHIKQGFLKVNNSGILIPKSVHNDEVIMINYSEINSINTTDQQVIINYNQGKIYLIEDYFDDEYKFRHFSNTVYSNFHTYRKVYNKNEETQSFTAIGK